MATYTFTINKQEVFAEVEKRSSLEGAAIPERFEGVWASAAEGAFLDSHWIEGCSLALQLFKRYIKNATSSTDLSTFTPSETFTIEADLPTRFDGNLVQNITTDMKMMMACTILNRWLAVVSPASAAKYDEESTGYTEDLKNKLMYRTAPTAKMATDTQVDSNLESGEYYGEKSGTETAMESGNYFATDSVDDTQMESGNYYGEKDDAETEFETGSELATKSGDSETMESGAYYITKKEDDYNFTQYEKCCNNP